MQYTVETLIALADLYSDAERSDYLTGESSSLWYRENLRTALTEALGYSDVSLINEGNKAQPVPPHECKTYEEKLAYAAGWWKALEANSAQPSTDDNLRLKFESEYRRLYPVLCDIRPNKFERDDEDSYAETIVNVAWNLFKAAQPVREPLTAQVLHDFSPIFGGDK
jgi:hypothetical protein